MFNSKKDYFKNKLDGVQRMLWDLEFKREKSKQIREDVRVEYDNIKHKLELIRVKKESEEKTPTMPKGDIARLDDEKVRMEKDLTRFEGQMKQIDLEIDGSKQTSEYPDGVVGINQQLDALRELHIMIKQYIKTI